MSRVGKHNITTDAYLETGHTEHRKDVVGVRAHSDLGGRRSSCPKKLHNARMCKC